MVGRICSFAGVFGIFFFFLDRGREKKKPRIQVTN